MSSRQAPRPVGEELPYSTIDRRVPQLGHGFGLDLSDGLTAELEVLTHLIERAGLASVEPEAQTQDLALPLVEWAQQLRGLGAFVDGDEQLLMPPAEPTIKTLGPEPDCAALGDPGWEVSCGRLRRGMAMASGCSSAGAREAPRRSECSCTRTKKLRARAVRSLSARTRSISAAATHGNLLVGRRCQR
jgi:hypothetical protein